MIVQKLLLIAVPLLFLVEAQDKDSVSREGFRRPIHREHRPVQNIPNVSENVNTDKEFSEVVTEENVSYSPIVYDDVTTSSASKTNNPESRVFTRKPLWSRRTSTSYFSRLSNVSPTTKINENTLKPQNVPSPPKEPKEPYTITLVTNEPLTSKSVTAESNKEMVDIITPTPQNKPDHILDTSNVPGTGKKFISGQTVTTNEGTESPQPEYSTTLIPRLISNFPTPRPSYNALSTSSMTTQEPTTQSVIKSTSPIAPLNPKPSNTAYQLNDYTCRNVNGYYSVENQCDEYVECQNNIAYRKLCPEGLHFNSAKKWPAFPCAYPFEVKCQSQSITPIEYVDASSEEPEPVTAKPEETEYSTPATTEQPTWELFWSRPTSTPHFSQFSTAIPTSTDAPKASETQFPTSIRATYAIFQPKETIEPYTTNVYINEATTSDSVTSQSNEYIPDDITSTYTNSIDDVSTTPTAATTITNKPISPQRPTWIFPSRPNNAPSTTSTTTTTKTPITQPIISFTTRPTAPQQLIPFYAVNQLNDYTCRNVFGYYSVENQCDEYVECQNNIAYRSLCPDGLHFDPEAKWPAYPCAYPSEVKCQRQAIIQHAQPTGQCPHRYGIFPTPNGDCGHFIMCQEGLATVMSCPSGLAFNSMSSVCDWPVNVPDCDLKVFQDFTCPSDDYARASNFISYHKYKNSCKEYIACQEGRPRLLSCEAGLSFDEKTNQCVMSKLIENCQNDI